MQALVPMLHRDPTSRIHRFPHPIEYHKVMPDARMTPLDAARKTAGPNFLSPEIYEWFSEATPEEIEYYLTLSSRWFSTSSPSYEAVAEAAAKYSTGLSEKTVQSFVHLGGDFLVHAEAHEARTWPTQKLLEALETSTSHPAAAFRHSVHRPIRRRRLLALLLAQRSDVTDADLAKVLRANRQDDRFYVELAKHPAAGPHLVGAMIETEAGRLALWKSPLVSVFWESPDLFGPYIVPQTFTTPYSLRNLNTLGKLHLALTKDRETFLSSILSFQADPRCAPFINGILEKLSELLASPEAPDVARSLSAPMRARLLALDASLFPAVPSLRSHLFATLHHPTSSFAI